MLPQQYSVCLKQNLYIKLNALIKPEELYYLYGGTKDKISINSSRHKKNCTVNYKDLVNLWSFYQCIMQLDYVLLELIRKFRLSLE